MIQIFVMKLDKIRTNGLDKSRHCCLSLNYLSICFLSIYYLLFVYYFSFFSLIFSLLSLSNFLCLSLCTHKYKKLSCTILLFNIYYFVNQTYPQSREFDFHCRCDGLFDKWSRSTSLNVFWTLMSITTLINSKVQLIKILI